MNESLFDTNSNILLYYFTPRYKSYTCHSWQIESMQINEYVKLNLILIFYQGGGNLMLKYKVI